MTEGWDYLSSCAEMSGVVVTNQDVDIFAISDKLAVTTDSELKPGMGLVIHAPGDTFWAHIVDAERADWGRHNWLVDVESTRMDELREALTYHVAGRAPDPPEYVDEMETVTGQVRQLNTGEFKAMCEAAKGNHG